MFCTDGATEQYEVYCIKDVQQTTCVSGWYWNSNYHGEGGGQVTVR